MDEQVRAAEAATLRGAAAFKLLFGVEYNASKFSYVNNPCVVFSKDGIRWKIPCGLLIKLANAIEGAENNLTENSIWRIVE